MQFCTSVAPTVFDELIAKDANLVLSKLSESLTSTAVQPRSNAVSASLLAGVHELSPQEPLD